MGRVVVVEEEWNKTLVVDRENWHGSRIRGKGGRRGGNRGAGEGDDSARIV